MGKVQIRTIHKPRQMDGMSPNKNKEQYAGRSEDKTRTAKKT